ncbi:hypothetical protein ACJX0J_008499, partial [Zea mays]
FFMFYRPITIAIWLNNIWLNNIDLSSNNIIADLAHGLVEGGERGWFLGSDETGGRWSRYSLNENTSTKICGKLVSTTVALTLINSFS